MQPQPLLCVADVPASSDFYATLLGAVGAHGGTEYGRLEIDGTLVLQLHAIEVGHHHGAMAVPDVPLGNGVAVWFETDDLDGAAARVHASGAPLDHDVHVNPNSGNREIWLRDPDGYLVVIAGR